MAAPRNRRHILVPGPPTAEAYKPHGRKIGVTRPAPPASRAKHGKALKRALEAAVVEARTRRDEAGIEVHGAEPGLYVQFESQPGVPLQVASLEDSRQGIEVVAVSHSRTEEPELRRIERATVFVPDSCFWKRSDSACVASAERASILEASRIDGRKWRVRTCEKPFRPSAASCFGTGSLPTASARQEFVNQRRLDLRTPIPLPGLRVARAR